MMFSDPQNKNKISKQSSFIKHSIILNIILFLSSFLHAMDWLTKKETSQDKIYYLIEGAESQNNPLWAEAENTAAASPKEIKLQQIEYIQMDDVTNNVCFTIPKHLHTDRSKDTFYSIDELRLRCLMGSYYRTFNDSDDLENHLKKNNEPGEYTNTKSIPLTKVNINHYVPSFAVKVNDLDQSLRFLLAAFNYNKTGHNDRRLITAELLGRHDLAKELHDKKQMFGNIGPKRADAAINKDLEDELSKQHQQIKDSKIVADFDTNTHNKITLCRDDYIKTSSETIAGVTEKIAKYPSNALNNITNYLYDDVLKQVDPTIRDYFNKTHKSEQMEIEADIKTAEKYLAKAEEYSQNQENSEERATLKTKLNEQKKIYNRGWFLNFILNKTPLALGCLTAFFTTSYFSKR